MRRRIALLLTSALLVLVPGAGMSAPDEGDVTTFSESAQSGGMDLIMVVTGRKGTGAHTILLCQARANGLAPLYTAVTSCKLTFADGVVIKGPLVRLPGPLAVSAGAKLHKIMPYTACMTAQIHYLTGPSKTGGFCVNGGS